jgi:hypothetical protein
LEKQPGTHRNSRLKSLYIFLGGKSSRENGEGGGALKMAGKFGGKKMAGKWGRGLFF